MTETDGYSATLLTRMIGAGLDETKARRWIEAGDVVIDSRRVTDPETLAPPGSRWLINPQ